MEKVTLNAEQRTGTGKGAARTLRRAGKVPAVLYRAGKSEHISIGQREFVKFIRDTAGEQVLVSLRFPDGKDRLAVIKDYQADPVRGEPLHTDFFEVSLTEKIKAMVHVLTSGEPLGVKRDGGILQHGLREIEVECLPEAMPGHIEADVSGLLTGHSIHVSNLRLPEGIKVITDLNALIATVTAPAVEKAVAEVAAVAAPAAPAEPEVIKKGKKEEEEVKEKAGKTEGKGQ